MCFCVYVCVCLNGTSVNECVACAQSLFVLVSGYIVVCYDKRELLIGFSGDS